MNMRVLKKSRKPVKAGDIFVYQMPDDLYRFGRVVRDDARIESWKGWLLLYFYRCASKTKLPVPLLDKDDLLLPPELNDRGGWTRGYFETVEHRPLEAKDVLPVHCFFSNSKVFDQYLDEYGKRLPTRIEPCGFHGLGSEVTLDYKLSRALNLKLSPPDPRHLVGWPRAFYKARVDALERQGLSESAAKVEAMRETVEIQGDRADEYAWPEVSGLASPKPTRRRGPLLPPPSAKGLSRTALRFYEYRMANLEIDGVPRNLAEAQAMRDTMKYLGKDVNEYFWPDLAPDTKAPKPGRNR